MKAFIFDTETTALITNGLLPLHKQPHVLEFYGVLVDLKTGKTSGELNYLIKPPISISPETEKITNIRQNMLDNSPPFSQCASKIFAAIEAAQAVLAHNCSYDCEIIDFEAKRLNYKMKWPRKICTVEQSIGLKGKRLKLGELHELLIGSKFEGAHRAKTDVEALTRVACEMFKRDML